MHYELRVMRGFQIGIMDIDICTRTCLHAGCMDYEYDILATLGSVGGPLVYECCL
jgi:hypothetical protein